MAAELRKRLTELFRWIDPGPDSSHLVSDISGWWRDPDTLLEIGPALGNLFRAESPTVVLAPEVTGLLIGPLVATALGVGFLPAYKNTGDRRIAEPTTWATTPPDYRGRQLALGVRDRHLGPADRVLVVDDWVASGAQVRALYQVISARGATPVGTAAIIADCPVELARELRVRSLLDRHDLAV
ncbi:phosphoribosyltransferase family protein [Micromonospora sp. NBC_01796]|uniref:phosphoribosyltransferase family protein n=1 Tax=Micromonospora sp. NBC_01796 TaxID=2975987 RepID=UPI002DDAA6C5|nr:phosphoribosyltransferase family protein [Micromonospora sp. NBC_01796]WSA88673.1 phosphoribosyltransferase family protein [Micromonospora sp. NBC_01796]